MSLKIRFRFDGRCGAHPRYNPERDGRPEHKGCSGCESLRVIQLYVSIARKKAKAGEGLIVFCPEALASSEASTAGAQNPDADTGQRDTEPEESNVRDSD